MPADTGERRFRTASTEETIALGERIGAHLEAGDVLVLTGDLGAGKTQLTKGIARGMGIAGDVTSPTFNILMVYDAGPVPLYHFDLYRLDDPDQLEDIGFYDALEGDGPAVIEWGEQFLDQIGDARMDVFLTRLDDEALPGEEPARELRLVAHGLRAEELLALL
jgi:tRNA threonylcarbamoyladenosine biosynthesis protein TsaE